MTHDNANGPTVPGFSPLAIIGIGCLFPKAEDSTTYWATIREGIDAITDIPASHWRVEDYHDKNPKTPDMTYGRRGGFISDVPFNPMDYNIPPSTLEAIDSSQLLGLVATGQALKDAGYGADRVYDRDRVSVILGVTGTLELVVPLAARLGHPHWRSALKDAGVDDATADDVVQRISDSYVSWQENSFPGLLGNVVAGRISKQFDLGGTNCVVDAACASSLSALHLASLELATGKSDMVVTGGIDTFNDIFMFMCFSKTPALSPSGDAKPFDAAGDGTILGEGLGIMVIKRLADAERDGDRIYAVIRGVGSSSDGKGEAIYTPSATGQKKALRDAYQRSGVAPDSIGLIEAHGTGTKVGDAVEVSALREVFGTADKPWCALGSVKSQIGHTKAAAGAAGLIKAALALHHKVLPPTIKVQEPLREVSGEGSPFYLSGTKRPWIAKNGQPRRAGVSALGFGGSNFHVVLEEYQPKATEIDWDGTVQILPFSAPDVASLDKMLADAEGIQSWSDIRILAATNRRIFEATAHCRLAITLECNKSNLTALCTTARTMLRSKPELSWHTPDGICYVVGTTPEPVAALFPGQGAQYTGMLRDLVCSFPAMFTTVETADHAFSAASGQSLVDLIYPPSSFGTDAKEADENALRDTQIAQPAIGAVSLGAMRLLASFGFSPDAAAGHSYGELTALCAAERLDEASFHALSRLRGQLMAAGTGDKGTMLAVSAPLPLVQKLVDEEQLDLVIANRNSPNQAVLSGSSSEIARAAAAAKNRSLACTPLTVAAAFHSPLVADAAIPFKAALASIPLSAGALPVYANSTASSYPVDEQEAKALLAGQLALPVEFVDEIEAMYDAGIRTFVEIGPGSRLAGLVGAILAGRPHAVVSLDSSSGKRSGIVDLARCLSQLAVTGYGIDLTKWDDTYTVPSAITGKKPLLTINLNGANYVKPKAKRPPVAPRATVIAPVTASAPSIVPLHSASPSLSPDVATESLRVTREGMTALMRMQDETAQLHRKFLEGQDAAGKTIQLLLEQQQRILQGGSYVAPPVAAAPSQTVPAVSAVVAQAIPPAPVTTVAVSPPLTTLLRSTVAEALLSVIAEKTGYPVEMLEMEMGLDSDLGIDSIKRVEILSALQERLPTAPIIGPEQLGSLHTLGEIAAFLSVGSEALVAATASTTAAAGIGTASPVIETLLLVVSEKTGYPVEMLELEMGLDSDLGIDSIKRVEILSALQERLPSAPVIGPEQLGTLHTLGEIATFLGAGSAAATPSAETGDADSSTKALLEVVSEKTGYPVEMLELDMGLESDLGIDSIKRVEILSALQERLPGSPVIGPEHLGTLHTLGEIARFLTPGTRVTVSSTIPLPEPLSTVREPHTEHTVAPLRRSTISAEPLTDSPESIRIAGNGTLWVTNDGSSFSLELCSLLKARGHSVLLLEIQEAFMNIAPADFSGLVICTPADGATDTFFENSFLLMKSLAPALQRAAENGGALFATVSRLDGSFGCGVNSTLCDPLSGGLAGLVKTAAHEWSDVTCKAIDIGLFSDPLAEAAAVAAELFKVASVEIGLTPAGRSTLTISELPNTASLAASPFTPGEVVIITGGGRGVTAAAAIALSRIHKPLLVLVGRSPEPLPELPWLAGLSEESQIKRGIMEHATDKLHPREVEERYHAIMAGRELKSTLVAIERAGGHGVYRSVDIRDGEMVAELCADIRRTYGPIRGVVHGAGVLADRLIGDKTLEQFAMVYSTKVAGLRSLLTATADDDLRFMALFSSTTGRFGRSGQLDYGVANEILNKYAEAESRLRPNCRVVSINWGPWDGGMVTPALKKLFSGEGIGLIDLGAGGELLAHEITTQGEPVEIVVLAGAGEQDGRTVTVGKATEEAYSLNLNCDDFPFICSHIIDGKAVLPMAVIVEWLAHGALHGNPGFRFHGFNNVRICKGVIFEQHASCSLQIMSGKAVKLASLFVVPVELIGVADNGSRVLHATAEIVLATKLPSGTPSLTELSLDPYKAENSPVYDNRRLFHGATLQGITCVSGCSAAGIAAQVNSAGKPSEWIKFPLRTVWLTDPLIVDCAFQLMILWSFERFGCGSLPTFAGSYRQYQEQFPRDGAKIIIKVTAERSHGATADIEFLDRSSGKLIARMETYECVIDPSLQQAFQRNQVALTRDEA